MTATPSDLLQNWLRRQLPADRYEWLDGRLDALAAEPSDRNLYITFGMIPRRLGKDDLALTPDDLDAAQAALGQDASAPKEAASKETAPAESA